MSKKLVLFVFALILSLTLLAQAGLAKDGKVTILTINRLSSQLLPIAEKVNKSSVFMGGLAHASGLINRIRDEEPTALLVEGGEAVFGPLWRHFGGLPEFTSLSTAGVDVGMIGKHEFDYGWEHLVNALQYVSFPLLISNAGISDTEAAKRFQKNIVLTSGSVKVGFFAMVSPIIFSTTKRVTQMTVDPDLTKVSQEMVRDLQSKGADIIVMLSNLTEEENESIAESVPGIHAIFGRGLSHKEESGPAFITGEDGWVTATVWGGSQGKFVGRLDILTQNGRITPHSVQWKLLNVTPKVPANPAIMKIASEYEEKLNRQLEKVVGFFETPVDIRKKTVRVREMPFGNFAADSLRWRFRTDIGLINSGALRGDRIFPAGEVFEKTLLKILPFSNEIDIVTVTGKQLRQIMELSASAVALPGEKYDASFRVPDGGFLQVSGLKVVYDMSRDPAVFEKDAPDSLVAQWGNRLQSLSVLKDGKWEPVEDNRKYTIAVNAWMVGGGDRYIAFRGAPVKKTGVTDLEALMDYLRSFPEGRLNLKTDGRIQIEGL